MRLPEYPLMKRKVVWMYLLVLLAGAALGFGTQGNKEHSVFVIKRASLVCSYRAVSHLEDEQLGTQRFERVVQSMRLLHNIWSEFYSGLSKDRVDFDPATRASPIRKLWYQLRRKELNIKPRLSAWASPVTVDDDLGDFNGYYSGLAVEGGVTWAQLRYKAQRIKTALVTVEGLRKLRLFLQPTPVVNVYLNLAARGNFGVRPGQIDATIC